MKLRVIRNGCLGSLCLLAGWAVLAADTAAVKAGSAAKPASAASAAKPGKRSKDVVLDAAQPASAPASRVAAPPVAPHGVFTTAVHDAAVSASLGDLGLALLRHQSLVTGQANVNQVVSPISVGSALGMVHAGTAGDTARELAALVSPAAAGQQGFAQRLPSLLERIGKGNAKTASPLAMANRVWVGADVAATMPAPFVSLVKQRYGAPAANLSFGDPEAARALINQWTATQTHGRIPSLLQEGSIKASTKVVVTNAVHFKSKWAVPFDPAATENLPFHAPGGDKPVPTMVDERPVLQGTIDNIQVIELPFADPSYALMVAMAPKGHTLDALEKDLAGLDMVSWSSQLKEKPCRLELPKFSIEGKAVSLKEPLKALGVRQLFSEGADLSPMLGAASKDVKVDDVIHSATIVIDETGGEASAATAATVQAKSLQLNAPPSCSVDRPFVFAIVHKPTAAPLFVGKVAKP